MHSFSINTDRLKHVKVFISYCHQSPEHSRDVLAIADRLCKDGIDCNIDQYIQAPIEGWPRWMDNQVQEADYVLIVCDELYDRRISGREAQSNGKGVRFERLLTFQDIYDNSTLNDKFIPIVMKKEDIPFIPKLLRAYQFYQPTNDEGYEDLYRRLTRQPIIQKPVGGELKTLATGMNIKSKESCDLVNQYECVRKTHIEKKCTKTETDQEIQNPVNRLIELRIAMNFDDFTSREQDRLLNAIRELLAINGDIKIWRIRPGSVLVTLELPADQAEKLLVLVQNGKLNEIHITNAELLDIIGIDLDVNQQTTKKNIVSDRLTSRESTMVITEGTNAIGIKASDPPLQGRVKWFNDKKGYGFIETDSGEDVFVHISAFLGFESLSEGERVTFTMENSEEEPKAAAKVRKL